MFIGICPEMHKVFVSVDENHVKMITKVTEKNIKYKLKFTDNSRFMSTS